MICQRLVKDDQIAGWHKRAKAVLGHLFLGVKEHKKSVSIGTIRKSRALIKKIKKAK